jgi:hypothetical protein
MVAQTYNDWTIPLYLRPPSLAHHAPREGYCHEGWLKEKSRESLAGIVLLAAWLLASIGSPGRADTAKGHLKEAGFRIKWRA